MKFIQFIFVHKANLKHLSIRLLDQVCLNLSLVLYIRDKSPVILD